MITLLNRQALSNANEIEKLRNLVFNPFSVNSRGRSHLILNSDLDPDHNNYYKQIINHIDSCDYYDEESFKNLTNDCTNTDFSILHLNIRSILNKYDDFKAYLDSLVHQFSVIGLSETWQNKTNVNAFPLLGYSNTGVTRKNKQGGGVTLYVSDSLQYRERADLSVNVEDVIESHFIEITSKPDCIIGIIYRPPNDKLDLFKNCLTEILEKIELV